MSTSYSRQDHGPRLPSRSVHATTRVRTRVKNKLRTSIQDLTVSPLFASLKRKWERQAPLLFLLLDIRDMSANVRPRPHARPQECATKNTTDRAAHADCGIERSGTKKKKTRVSEIHWDKSCSSSHKLWSSGGGQRHARIAKTRRIFFTLTTTTTSPPPAWSARPAGLGGPP